MIRWSQPEIVLYDDDPIVRMSYPDLVEEGERFYLTETQKDVARVHEVPVEFVKGLWGQFDQPTDIARNGLILELRAGKGGLPGQVAMPSLPRFLGRNAARHDQGTLDRRAGFSLELWLRLVVLEAGQTVLDNRTEDGRGFCLQIAEQGTLEIVLNDRQTENRWSSDPGTLAAGKLHHVVVTVDAGPKIVCFVADGALCDGGEHRQFGWGRFSPHLRDANGGPTRRSGPGLRGEVVALRVYGRSLRTSEAVGNYRMGCSRG